LRPISSPRSLLCDELPILPNPHRAYLRGSRTANQGPATPQRSTTGAWLSPWDESCDRPWLAMDALLAQRSSVRSGWFSSRADPIAVTMAVKGLTQLRAAPADRPPAGGSCSGSSTTKQISKIYTNSIHVYDLY